MDGDLAKGPQLDSQLPSPAKRPRTDSQTQPGGTSYGSPERYVPAATEAEPAEEEPGLFQHLMPPGSDQLHEGPAGPQDCPGPGDTQLGGSPENEPLAENGEEGSVSEEVVRGQAAVAGGEDGHQQRNPRRLSESPVPRRVQQGSSFRPVAGPAQGSLDSPHVDSETLEVGWSTAEPDAKMVASDPTPLSPGPAGGGAPSSALCAGLQGPQEASAQRGKENDQDSHRPSPCSRPAQPPPADSGGLPVTPEGSLNTEMELNDRNSPEGKKEEKQRERSLVSHLEPGDKLRPDTIMVSDKEDLWSFPVPPNSDAVVPGPGELVPHRPHSVTPPSLCTLLDDGNDDDDGLSSFFLTTRPGQLLKTCLPVPEAGSREQQEQQQERQQEQQQEQQQGEHQEELRWDDQEELHWEDQEELHWEDQEELHEEDQEELHWEHQEEHWEEHQVEPQEEHHKEDQEEKQEEQHEEKQEEHHEEQQEEHQVEQHEEQQEQHQEKDHEEEQDRHRHGSFNERFSQCDDFPAAGSPEHQLDCEPSHSPCEVLQEVLDLQSCSGPSSSPQREHRKWFHRVLTELNLFFDVSISDNTVSHDQHRDAMSPEPGAHRDPDPAEGSCAGEQEVPADTISETMETWTPSFLFPPSSMCPPSSICLPSSISSSSSMCSPSTMCPPFLEPLSLRQQDQTRRLEPLKTCTRPIRVGLSKRVKTKQLHRLHPYK